MHMKKKFEVKVITNEVVTLTMPVQEHHLPLSNLDLLLPPEDLGVFFCYDKPKISFGVVVDVLKKSLAKTLDSYYPLAGRLVENGAGQPEILCNNQGVEFIEALADVELKNLDLYNPDESVEGKLVPERKHSLVMVQVTQLKCGGMVVACTFTHQVVDAYSVNMFLVSWAEMAQPRPLSHSPCFHRSLLSPRLPGSYHTSVNDMYMKVSDLPPGLLADPSAISRIYYIKADQVNDLQALANNNNSNEKLVRRSKLEAFSAFLWKMMASSENLLSSYNSCMLGIVVNGRSRLIDKDEMEGHMIASYFGNVLSIPYGEKKIWELKEKPLSWVANEVHNLLQNAITKEHFLGLIDWVEERRPARAMTKMRAALATEEEPGVVVSSGLLFPVTQMNFGWGKPIFGSYHFPWEGKCGYVMPMPSPKGNGDWIVYMHLLKEKIDLIETNAAHALCPITCDYLFS